MLESFYSSFNSKTSPHGRTSIIPAILTSLGLTFEVFLAGFASLTAGKIPFSFLLNRSLNCRLIKEHNWLKKKKKKRNIHTTICRVCRNSIAWVTHIVTSLPEKCENLKYLRNVIVRHRKSQLTVSKINRKHKRQIVVSWMKSKWFWFSESHSKTIDYINF